jgi:hypothetical protein
MGLLEYDPCCCQYDFGKFPASNRLQLATKHKQVRRAVTHWLPFQMFRRQKGFEIRDPYQIYPKGQVLGVEVGR